MIVIIGFIGELLKILSFWIRTRHLILLTQAIASIVLCLFWFLMNENGLAVVTFLNIIINLHADRIKNSKFMKITYHIYYPLIIFLFYILNDTNYYFLMLSLLTIYSRSGESELVLRKRFLIPQIGFIFYNFKVIIPSLLFSAVFSFIFNIYRLRSIKD